MSTFVTVLPQLLTATHEAINELVLESAQAVADGVISAMDEGKSGVKYTNLPNTSSASGEAPATQSGDYAASTKAEPNGDGKAGAYTTALQAARLEYGDAKVAARPNWVIEATKEAAKSEDRGAKKLNAAAQKVSL